MQFSPGYLSISFIEPIRYLFSKYNGTGPLYNPDPKISGLEIGSINDFHKVKVQTKPRILISRGGYQISSTGLTDNMAERKSLLETGGLNDQVKMLIISGQIQILIQARQEGTCELLTDMVQHFITWTAPFLCNTQGFKMIGMPSVSPCTPGREDTEIFEVSIGVPWTKEEHWNVQNDALKLKDFRFIPNPN